MPQPLVSVIVPAYNAAGFISRCVESITSQSYPELEILLLNDGSTDDTLAVCRKLAAADSRIRVVVLKGEASDTVVLDLVPGNGVGYTVPQRVRPADVDRSVNISFRVRQNYGPSQITVTCGGRQLARFKRQRMAPGEMEHIALPKVLLEKADGPLTVAVEEVIAE